MFYLRPFGNSVPVVNRCFDGKCHSMLTLCSKPWLASMVSSERGAGFNASGGVSLPESSPKMSHRLTLSAPWNTHTQTHTQKKELSPEYNDNTWKIFLWCLSPALTLNTMLCSWIDASWMYFYCLFFWGVGRRAERTTQNKPTNLTTNVINQTNKPTRHVLRLFYYVKAT